MRDGIRHDVVHVIHDVGRAIVRDGVVELGPSREPVGSREHLDEQCSDTLVTGANRVDVNVVATVHGARSDEITLVADDVDHLELLEQSGDRTVRLARLASRFDGDRNVLRVGKPEADERVRRATPALRERSDDEPDGLEFLEVVAAVIVCWCELLLRRLREIAESMDEH